MATVSLGAVRYETAGSVHRGARQSGKEKEAPLNATLARCRCRVLPGMMKRRQVRLGL